MNDRAVCHGPESCQMDSLFLLAIAMLLHGHQKIPLQFVTPVCRTRPALLSTLEDAAVMVVRQNVLTIPAQQRMEMAGKMINLNSLHH